MDSDPAEVWPNLTSLDVISYLSQSIISLASDAEWYLLIIFEASYELLKKRSFLAIYMLIDFREPDKKYQFSAEKQPVLDT